MKAILFDLDGVLVDTEATHYEALIAAVCEFTSLKDADARFVLKKDGTSTLYKLGRLALSHGIDLPTLNAIDEYKQTLVNHAFSFLTPNTRLQDLLADLKRHSRLAIVSNTRFSNLAQLVSKLGINQYFDSYYTPDFCVKHPKPSPALYKYAMERMRVLPRETLIIEDSEAGIRAAMASGAHTIHLTDMEHLYDPDLLPPLVPSYRSSPDGWERQQIFDSGVYIAQAAHSYSRTADDRPRDRLSTAGC